MVSNHGAIIHFIDMVACQNQYIIRLVCADNIEILVHRICGTRVPGVLYPLLRRQQLDKFLEFTTQEAPAVLNMLDQGMCLVLCQDTDHADIRVHAIRQREIDNAELAAKGNRGFGAPQGQLAQSGASPPRQNECQGVAGQSADIT